MRRITRDDSYTAEDARADLEEYRDALLSVIARTVGAGSGRSALWDLRDAAEDYALQGLAH
jgi:hypothetical protein